MTADLHFYFDPVCPFAWMISKCVRAIGARRRSTVDRRPCRNGYHGEREVMTAAGAVPVRAPRVNDKRVDAETASGVEQLLGSGAGAVRLHDHRDADSRSCDPAVDSAKRRRLIVQAKRQILSCSSRPLTSIPSAQQ